MNQMHRPFDCVVACAPAVRLTTLEGEADSRAEPNATGALILVADKTDSSGLSRSDQKKEATRMEDIRAATVTARFSSGGKKKGERVKETY